MIRRNGVYLLFDDDQPVGIRRLVRGHGTGFAARRMTRAMLQIKLAEEAERLARSAARKPGKRDLSRSLADDMLIAAHMQAREAAAYAVLLSEI